ncbi:class I SAM-dependent methyltransferase [Litoribacter ruber]|uniref:class I SAM-dependent methyltransferase n=1 Tax=Litoribacter ruber TaxID=702568 RepID=UPI001BDB42CA|nr:class I SAM-dependent methyltransferase [Litoribacter ruber]MBT0813043.1 class I SAM-dependent methyltransferase [Litoribacter ruber]
MKTLNNLKHKLIQGVATKLRSDKKNLYRFFWFARQVSPDSIAILDYPVKLSQRYSGDKPHEGIKNLFHENHRVYREFLETFLIHKEKLKEISPLKSLTQKKTDPTWDNYWLPGLDAVAIYGFISLMKPNLFLEVGSGNSTKFATKAIKDKNLNTKIISIDPFPREEIDEICDVIIRSPLEEVDLEIFDQLNENDILFIDNSHRVLMNSDVTTFFLDILPRLKKGVIVQIHDVFLPYDYPKDWADRFYSEQYMLASLLLYNNTIFDILLPLFYLSKEVEFDEIIKKFFVIPGFNKFYSHGQSIWLKVK